jgi:hypothetical protein
MDSGNCAAQQLLDKLTIWTQIIPDSAAGRFTDRAVAGRVHAVDSNGFRRGILCCRHAIVI